jgi:nucleotide-binding universal stress UspA family protein
MSSTQERPAEATTAVSSPFTSILVATDGTQESDAAISLAAKLAAGHGASLSAVTVAEYAPSIPENPSMFPPIQLLEDPAVTRETRKAAVDAQCERLLGARIPVAVRFGSVGGGIAEFAVAENVSLLVTGRGRHQFTERLLGEEHLARLLRSTICPVLAATPALTSPPKCVVVGIDFSATDSVTARAAVDLMDGDGRVYLVHVKPDIPFAVPTAGAWKATYDEGARAGLERIRREMGLSPANAECVIIAGHPGHALVDFASRVKADLLAVGTHGQGFIHRFVIGSTATYLLRLAPCSLLAVPSVAVVPAARS